MAASCEVADRVVVRERIAREGAPQRIALELVVSTGAPTMPSNEAAPTNRFAAGVISTRTPCPARVASRASSKRLVGGDPAAHAEEDAGHLGALTRAPAQAR